jgi:pentatricopeptide repeat protein
MISQPGPKRDMNRRGGQPPKEEIDDALAVPNWPSTITPVPVTSAAQMDTSPQSNRGSTSQGLHRVVNESLDIWNHHVPNHITYAICIQVYSFHGNYRRALQIFRDMITSNQVESVPISIKIPYTAMHKVYRALFLGFARVSRKFAASDEEEIRPSVPDEQEREWISSALEVALDGFLDMEPRQGRPNDRTVLWIMYAFSNISQGDTEKLIRVWRLLEERFGTLHVPYSFRQIAKAAQKEDT